MGLEVTNIREHAKTLIKLKGQNLSLLKLLGAKWIALKVLMVAVGVSLLAHPDASVKWFGVFLLGYALGSAGAGIRSQLFTKRHWPLQQQLFDWAKIEALAKTDSNATDTKE